MCGCGCWCSRDAREVGGGKVLLADCALRITRTVRGKRRKGRGKEGKSIRGGKVGLGVKENTKRNMKRTLSSSGEREDTLGRHWQMMVVYYEKKRKWRDRSMDKRKERDEKGRMRDKLRQKIEPKPSKNQRTAKT